MSGYLDDIKRALTPTKLKTDDSKEAQSESPSTVCSRAPTRLEEQKIETPSHQRKNEYLSEIPWRVFDQVYNGQTKRRMNLKK